MLKVIKANSLQLRLKKCAFMHNEVIYLGCKINKDGIFPVKEKTDAIKRVKEPTNVSELKSFLGVLNYYYRHFQNFADTLEPQASFQKAKLILNETKFLVHYNP